MANNFKRYTSRNIGTSDVTIGSYVVGANTQTTVIGFSLANVSNTAISCTARLYNGSNYTHLIKSAPVPVGSTLVVLGGDQKLVMESGDSIVVSSTASNSVDAILSILEI